MQKNLINIFVIFSMFLPLCLLSGCESWLPEAHKIDIQQGNRIKQKDLDKLKLGMNKKQVKFVLGTPLLRDTFHKNRWDYIFYLKPGEGDVEQSRLVLYFEADELVKIDNSHFVAQDKKSSPKD